MLMSYLDLLRSCGFIFAVPSQVNEGVLALSQRGPWPVRTDLDEVLFHLNEQWHQTLSCVHDVGKREEVESSRCESPLVPGTRLGKEPSAPLGSNTHARVFQTSP